MNLCSCIMLITTFGVLAAVTISTESPAQCQPLESGPRVTIPLSGRWEFLPEHDDEQLQNGDSHKWGNIVVPGLWWNAKDIDPAYNPDATTGDAKRKIHQVHHCWYRKTFSVDRSLTGANCLLRITDVRWSAEVWLNGVLLGKHVGAYRPVEFDATKAIRPGEENIIVIKNGGGLTIPKYEDGVTPRIVFGHKGWAEGASGIMGDIEMRFFQKLTVSRIKIDSNIGQSSCSASIWVANHSTEPRQFSLSIQARERKSGHEASAINESAGEVGPGQVAHVTCEVPVRNMSLWSPETPFLYYMDVKLRSGEDGCDSLEETFGMREFTIKEGDFYLNGKRIFLRGATDLAITGFPSWGVPAETLNDRKWIKSYLVDTARGMNVDCFRTHMGPWYKPYYEIADEYGQMIIAEFPNWPPEGGPEYYHRPGWVETLHSEMELIAANLWNHPSVIIWAGCNEPYNWDYDEDEKKYLEPFFRELDPTRPMMRAGAVSEAIADQHGYQGFWVGTIGNYVGAAKHMAETNPDKPWCDTEYLETSPRQFARPDWGRAQKWMGYNVTLERAEKIHALFAMEQTEVKRRLQYDGLLPFWYAMFIGKGKTPGEEKWLTYYSLKNAFAPMAVSLDIYDRHFVTGSDLNLKVWTMNDLDVATEGKINVYIVREDPPYTYEAPPVDPLASKKLNVGIPPYSSTPHEVRLPLPQQEGDYWLYATLEVKGRETVISKRPMHVLDRSVSLEPAANATIAILEQETTVQDWAKKVGATIAPVDGFSYPTLVIGKDAVASETVSSRMKKIEEWVNSGGRLVILDQRNWPEGMFGLYVEKGPSDVAYLFKEKGHEDEAIWANIEDAYMENWNGFGAEGLTHRITGKPKGDKRGEHAEYEQTPGEVLCIGSAGQQGLNAPAIVRIKMGEGEILACQALIADRLTEGTPGFDPVAERLMVNLITTRR